MKASIITLFFCVATLALLDIKDRKKLQIIYWIFFIPLFILAGWREIGIDQDSEGYEFYYNSDDIALLAEPTFVWISSFVHYAFHDIRYLFVIYAFLGVFLKYLAINSLTPLLLLSLAIYIGKVYGLYDLNAIRASVSASLLLFCIQPLSKREPLKFFPLVVLAILFHYSAFLFLPLWFLSNEELTFKSKFIMGSIIPIAYLFCFLNLNLVELIPIPLIQRKLDAYALAETMGKEDSSGVNIFNLVQLGRCTLFYYLLYFYDTLKLKVQSLSIMMKILLISIILLPLFSFTSILSLRSASLFAVVDIILFPLIYYTIKPRVVGKVIVVLIATFFLFFYLYMAEVVSK